MLHQAGEIDAPEYGFVLPGEMEQPENDFLAAVRLFHDHLQVFAPLREGGWQVQRP